MYKKNAITEIEPLTVDTKTAAAMLNVCERTIRTLTKRGELPVIRIMGRVLYSREDLEDFVRRRSKKEPQNDGVAVPEKTGVSE